MENKQKAYLYLYSNDEDGQEPIAIFYANDFPNIGEDISLFDGENNEFKFYHVVKRIYGINKLSESSVWNIYVVNKED